MAPPRPPHVGFVLEQTLGHVVHAQNLRTCIVEDGRVDATFLPVPFDVGGLAAHVPGYGNWTVRAGMRARRAVRGAHRDRPLDALFVHTQVPAVLLGRWMSRVPTVVSLDATPLQYDELGAHYGHVVGAGRVEAWKHAANRRMFARAAGLVTWSAWAARGLQEGYGVPPERVHVVPPGVHVDDWAPPEGGCRGVDDVVRILFVGADFERKGGDVLLDAFAVLRARVGPRVELHLVTKAEVRPVSGVHVHGALAPNSAQLRALFHRSDLFCLPTRSDCLPLVLSEAGASGLAAVSTTVGAIGELVEDGVTGLLVPPDDVAALTRALQSLVDDAPRRARLGLAAQARVRARYDATRNAATLIDLVSRLAKADLGAHP